MKKLTVFVDASDLTCGNCPLALESNNGKWQRCQLFNVVLALSNRGPVRAEKCAEAQSERGMVLK